MTIEEIQNLPREVNASRLKVTALLWRGESTCSEISRFSGVGRANVTSLVDSMERDGLAERRTRPGDRRAVYVRLTRRGRAIARKFIHSEKEVPA